MQVEVKAVIPSFGQVVADVRKRYPRAMVRLVGIRSERWARASVTRLSIRSKTYTAPCSLPYPDPDDGALLGRVAVFEVRRGA